MDISKLPRLSQTSQPAEAGTPADAPLGTPVATTPPASATTWCARCNAPNPAGTRYCGNCGAELYGGGSPGAFAPPADVQPGVGAEVWISAIVGVVMMLIGMNFAKWAVAALSGHAYQTNVTWQVGERAGQMVEYWDLEGFTALQDAAFFLFGLAMLLEAVVVLLSVHSRMGAKKPLLLFALAITLAATALNLLVSVKLFAIGLIPLMSLLAVGFGGYIAAYEWRLYQHFQRSTRRA
jgi:hypothetical protein